MSRPPLTEVVPRLGKLLLMLSSEPRWRNALGRVALSTGHSRLPELTGTICWKLLVNASTETANKKSRDDHSNDDWRAMRTFCERHSNFLSRREKEFIADIRHWRGSLTHKQHHWLVVIFKRVQRRAG